MGLRIQRSPGALLRLHGTEAYYLPGANRVCHLGSCRDRGDLAVRKSYRDLARL